MRDIERALAEVSGIRAQLAASTQFRGFAPEALAIIAGVTALVTVVAQFWTGAFPADNRSQVILWGGVLACSGGATTIEAILRSRHLHGGMGAPMLRFALRISLPFAAVGTTIAFAIGAYAPQAIWLVPGIWMLLLALVAFAFFPIMPRNIVWLGLWYLCCGTTLLFAAGPTGQLQPWMMGAPLTGGHLIVAFLLSKWNDEVAHG